MRTTTARLLAALFALAALAGACGNDDDVATPAADQETTTSQSTADDGTTTTPGGSEGTEAAAEVPDGPTIVVGAQNFGESAILAELYGQALSSAGYPVEQQALGGFRDLVYTSFENDEINFTLEYVSSTLEFLNDFAGEASEDLEASMAALDVQLDERGLEALEPAPAENSNVFVVTRQTADEMGLSSLSDLTEEVVLGGPPDCEENAACIPGLMETYGVDLSGNFVPLDGGGPLTVAALEAGEIDVAILFSTDPLIEDNDWVVLEDDEGLINVENIVPVTTDEVVEAYGEDFVALVDRVSAALTTSGLAELNRQFQVENEDADAVARAWLEEQGFVD